MFRLSPPSINNNSAVYNSECIPMNDRHRSERSRSSRSRRMDPRSEVESRTMKQVCSNILININLFFLTQLNIILYLKNSNYIKILERNNYIKYFFIQTKLIYIQKLIFNIVQ